MADVRREQLEHVLRATRSILTATPRLDRDQAILAWFGEDVLPPAAMQSIEVDVAFFDDPGDTNADVVDAAIGRTVRLLRQAGLHAGRGDVLLDLGDDGGLSLNRIPRASG